jgi:hypothetical protein
MTAGLASSTPAMFEQQVDLAFVLLENFPGSLTVFRNKRQHPFKQRVQEIAATPSLIRALALSGFML